MIRRIILSRHGKQKKTLRPAALHIGGVMICRAAERPNGKFCRRRINLRDEEKVSTLDMMMPSIPAGCFGFPTLLERWHKDRRIDISNGIDLFQKTFRCAALRWRNLTQLVPLVGLREGKKKKLPDDC